MIKVDLYPDFHFWKVNDVIFGYFNLSEALGANNQLRLCPPWYSSLIGHHFWWLGWIYIQILFFQKYRVFKKWGNEVIFGYFNLSEALGAKNLSWLCPLWYSSLIVHHFWWLRWIYIQIFIFEKYRVFQKCVNEVIFGYFNLSEALGANNQLRLCPPWYSSLIGHHYWS